MRCAEPARACSAAAAGWGLGASGDRPVARRGASVWRWARVRRGRAAPARRWQRRRRRATGALSPATKARGAASNARRRRPSPSVHGVGHKAGTTAMEPTPEVVAVFAGGREMGGVNQDGPNNPDVNCCVSHVSRALILFIKVSEGAAPPCTSPNAWRSSSTVAPACRYLADSAMTALRRNCHGRYGLATTSVLVIPEPLYISRAPTRALTRQRLEKFNELVIAGLEVAEEVTPGQIRTHSVANHQGAPAADRAFLLDRLRRPASSCADHARGDVAPSMMTTKSERLSANTLGFSDSRSTPPLPEHGECEQSEGGGRRERGVARGRGGGVRAVAPDAVAFG